VAYLRNTTFNTINISIIATYPKYFTNYKVLQITYLNSKEFPNHNPNFKKHDSPLNLMNVIFSEYSNLEQYVIRKLCYITAMIMLRSSSYVVNGLLNTYIVYIPYL
jgi:hypothetical protein